MSQFSPLTQCQRFQNSLTDLEAFVDELQPLLESFAATTDPSLIQIVKEKLDSYRSPQDFIKEYQEKTRDILMKYFATISPFPDPLMKHVIFEPSGRVVYNTNLPVDFMGKRTIPVVTYFPSVIRRAEGFLQLKGTKITNLDWLEEVTQDMDMEGLSTLQSAARLRKVGRLSIRRTNISHLDSLEEAVKIDAVGLESLVSVKSLRRTKWYLDLRGTGIKTLESLEEVGTEMYVGGYFDSTSNSIRTSSFVSAPKLISIGGGLILSYADISDFRQAFPLLKNIGIHGKGVSFSTSSGELKKQIEDLKEKGELQYDGIVELVT